MTQSLAGVPGIDLCMLYGSFCRGTATAEGDLDVLVVAEASTTGSRKAHRLLHNRPDIARLASISTVRTCDLLLEQRTRPSFVAHLRDEGEPVGSSAGGNHRVVLPILQSETMPFALAREVEDRVDSVAPSLRHNPLNGAYPGAQAAPSWVSKHLCPHP